MGFYQLSYACNKMIIMKLNCVDHLILMNVILGSKEMLLEI